MSCQTVQKSLSALLDERLADEERNSVSQHLARCRDCAARWQDLLHVKKLLRDLPPVAVPEQLASELQVVASHQRAHHLATITLRSSVRHWLDGAKLFSDNLMRPLALPFAGGLLSALVLFTMLVPRLNFQRLTGEDVPTVFYTEASVEEMPPFGFSYDETVVELTIDERGRITDYSVPHGKLTRDMLNNIGNMMLFSRFTPATWFGQPTSGKVLVSFRRSHIVVKG